MSKKNRWLSAPYLAFILCGTVIPLLAILYYALVDKNGSFTFSNLASIAEQVHVKALGLSLLLALITTVICLLLALMLLLAACGRTASAETRWGRAWRRWRLEDAGFWCPRWEASLRRLRCVRC